MRAGAAVPIASDPHAPLACSALRLGMPHLGVVGLSEEWLLRHLGHVHWEMLESTTSQRSRTWADARGHRLYASFVALEVSGALLASAGEGDDMLIESGLERVGNAVYTSRHRLTVAGRMDSALVELVTIFVRRLDGHSNNFERVPDGPTLEKGPPPTRRPLALLNDHRAFRTTRDASHVVARESYPVRTHEDFNAAGMVYFANYSRFANRLLLATDGGERGRALVRRRSFFYGNVNQGDSVCVEAFLPSGATQRTRISRVSDGHTIAFVETEWQ